MKMKSAEIAPKRDEQKSVEINLLLTILLTILHFSLFQTLGPAELEVVKALRKAEAATVGTSKSKEKRKRGHFLGRPRPEKFDGEKRKYRFIFYSYYPISSNQKDRKIWPTN